MNPCPLYTPAELRKRLADWPDENDPDELAFQSHLESCAVCLEQLAAMTADPEFAQLASGGLSTGSGGTTESLGADPSLERPCGPYVFLRRLGEGGFGIVFAARHQNLGRIDAVKILKRHRSLNKNDQERFLGEGRALAELDHPHIVRVYDAGIADDAYYLAMELVSGQSLKERLKGEKLSQSQAVSLVLAVAQAAAAAHAKGITHRDIKPANILLGDNGVIKLTDFGIAVWGDQKERLTEDGVVGSLEYLSPERLEEAAGDHSADVYSLGVVLYQLLTGELPIPRREDESAPAYCDRLLFELPYPPSRLAPGLNANLDAICLRCLAKRPSQRYASASELATDLKRFQEGFPPLHAPLLDWRWVVRHWAWRQRRVLSAVGAVAAVVLLVLAASFLWRSWQAGIISARLEGQLRKADAQIAKGQVLEAARLLRETMATAEAWGRNDIREAASRRLARVDPQLAGQDRLAKFSQAYEVARGQRIHVFSPAESALAWREYLHKHETALTLLHALAPGDAWLRTADLQALPEPTREQLQTQVAQLRAAIWDAHKQSRLRGQSLTQTDFVFLDAATAAWALPRVFSVTLDSPAENAGLRVNDRILTMQGKSLWGISNAEWSKLLLGSGAGEEVVLEVARGGESQLRTFRMTRNASGKIGLTAESCTPPQIWLTGSADQPASGPRPLFFIEGAPADGAWREDGYTFAWAEMLKQSQLAQGDWLTLQGLVPGTNKIVTWRVPWDQDRRQAQLEAAVDYYRQDMLEDTLGGVLNVRASRDSMALQDYHINDPAWPLERCLTNYYQTEFGLPEELLKIAAEQAVRDQPKYTQALALLGKQDLAGAETLAFEVVTETPDFAVGWRTIALCDMQRSLWLAASAAHSRYIQLRPNNSLAYFFRARCRYEHGEGVAALADIERALQINPELPNGEALRQLIQGGGKTAK